MQVQGRDFTLMTVSNAEVTPQRYTSIMAIVLFICVIIIAWSIAGDRQAIAAVIGGLAGFSLYHAAFGFTAAWRRVVTEGKGAGLRAQFLLIGLTAAVSFPLIAWTSAGGFVFPVGVGMIFGAFLFGIGMQFGGGCGSGTLFVAGGGSTRMVITLAAFVAGSLLGTLHVPWWNTLPRIKSWSMITNFGPIAGYILLAAILSILAFITIWRERRIHGKLEEPKKTTSFVSGPWSPVSGAIALAIVGIATIIFIGRPWGVTSGFALWGAKIATNVGVDVASWPYWRGQVGRIERSVFYDITSVMNFGIIVGAMLAASLANRFQPIFRLGIIDVSTAVFGGLLMGYGARLAYGCNIGAYLGGLISGSLHGWVWAVAAFAGSTLAVIFKRRFQIS